MRRLHRSPDPSSILRALACWGLLAAHLTLSQALEASPPLTARELEHVKFLTAEKLLTRGDSVRLTRLIDELRTYPLHPYLVAAAFLDQIDTRSQADLETLNAQLRGGPLRGRVQRAWLRSLGRRARWEKLLANFSPDIGARDIRCLHLRALIEQGHRTEAQAAGKALWLVGRSQPDECNHAFRELRRTGFINAALTRQRLQLAMAAGKTRLVRFLMRALPGPERALPSAWLALRRDPTGVAAYLGKGFESVIEQSMRRLAYRNPKRAITLLHQLRSTARLSNDLSARVARHIGLALTRDQQHREARDWLLDADPTSRPIHDDPLTTARIINALALGEWEKALMELTHLSPEARTAERWRHWRAVALSATGDFATAQAIWDVLARERSYYGYLAADRISRTYQLNDKPFSVSPEHHTRIENDPSFQRAVILAALGRQRDLRREWRHLAQGSPEELVAAARMAHRRGWHGCAILTLAQSGYLDDLEVRFPLVFESDVRVNAAAHGLNPAWILATMRQESAFMTDARSAKGALGLMQLMPPTGRELAARLNIPLQSNADLLWPAKNIRLGSAYLKQLLRELGSPVLASAAYNAGPRRVRAWLPGAQMPAELWVELIPFTETRKYVTRVLMYSVIYEHRLGIPPTRLRDLLTPILPSSLLNGSS